MMQDGPSPLVRAFQNLDQFRVVSRDLTRGTFSGSVFTAIAYCALLLLLIAELGAFLRSSFETEIVIDENDNKQMTINFDVVMHDLPCKYLKLGVWDKFGFEQIDAAETFHYLPVDHTGANRGAVYTKDEIAALEAVDTATDVTDEEKKDLDADWASSSDHFKHNDFHKAVTFHDFTLVNFFAEWCSHCRQFAPTWNKIAAEVSEKMAFNDGDGRQATVKFMKVNCVDFGTHCQDAKIAAFPTMRLYKRDGSFEAFRNKRSQDNVIEFLKNSIAASHTIVAKHHNMFAEGCQVLGTFSVPRVPGHFWLQAEPFGDVAINPALTNVSHKVNHFSFGDKNALRYARRQGVPAEMFAHLSPLDAQNFIVDRFHEAPQHYLKVVSTQVDKKKNVYYQMTHTKRTRKLKLEHKEGLAPQVRFTWDFSPMAIVVKPKGKKWYEFLTSLFAILGGTYTIVELFGGAVGTVSNVLKDAMGKAS